MLRPPPPEAVDACKGKSEGDSVSFSFRDGHQPVAQLLERPGDRRCVKIALAHEMAIKAALGQTQLLHDLADAVQFRAVLPERPRSRGEDLLMGLGFLLRRVPHVYKITTGILEMQDIIGEWAARLRLARCG